MRDPHIHLSERAAGVYGDSDAEYDECPHCDSTPCQCDSIYEQAAGK